jgi:tetratricopeptide (TPR) repeat protein
LALLLLAGCVDSRESLDLLNEAERQMTDRPDSAKTTLESIVRRTVRTRKSRARFALLYSQALDKNFIDVDCDSLACIATAYYRSRGNPDEKALAFYYRGRVYENAWKVDSAIIFYNQAEQYIAKTKNFYLKGLVANALAGMYSSQRFSSLAKDKYLEAAGYFERIGHKKNMLINYAGAISHFEISEDSEDCDHYLNLAEAIALELKDTVTLIGLARFRAYRAIKGSSDYNRSLKIIRNASAEYCNNSIDPSYYWILAMIYLNLEKTDSAFMYLQPLIEQTANEHSRKRTEILYMAASICKVQNKYEQAYRYSNEALCISDSIYFAEKDRAIPELKAKYRNEQLILRNRYLKKISIYQGYVALTILIAVLSGALWLINRRQQKILQQKRQIREYRDAMIRLKEEYETLQRNNTSRGESVVDEEVLTRRIEFLKQLLDTASNFKHDKDKFQSKIEGLLTKNGSKKEKNDILPMFTDLINMRHPGIIGYIMKKYPLITESEVALYCMICMDVSKSAVCLVLGCQAKTYYNYRNVLRNKLHIANDDITIRQHFQLLCEEYRKS